MERKRQKGTDQVGRHTFARSRPVFYAKTLYISQLLISDHALTLSPLFFQQNFYEFRKIVEPVLSEYNHGTLSEVRCPPSTSKKKSPPSLPLSTRVENTQKQIDKLQDLKKATMNELLTKGIGHTEFKASELGRIPKLGLRLRLN